SFTLCVPADYSGSSVTIVGWWFLPPLRRSVSGAFPVDPVDQNRAWYRLFKTVEKEPAVDQVHRDFLLLRDYTALSVLFLIFYGAVRLYAISSLKGFGLYIVLLIVQYI